jgi:hypothetical protein
MATVSCASPSALPAPDKPDTAIALIMCPPSLLVDVAPIPSKPAGASVIAADPGTPEATATEAFFQWVQSLVDHAMTSDKRAGDIKSWCAGRQN